MRKSAQHADRYSGVPAVEVCFFYSEVYMKHEVRWYPENGLIKDKYGRTRVFRGINLGGVKAPVSPEVSGTYDISYTDRPFPEAEADIHFSRLAKAGFNLIRWGVTWEAVEHDGPEMYDEDFLAYTRRMIKKAGDYGFTVIIEPYQNAWSRWTGGCGAPLWTLEMAGFNVGALEGCGAVDKESVSLNYSRYACQTMFTLFFAGNTFAPDFLMDGIPAQEFLQEHYIAAMYHVARRLKDCENIIGFGIMNEASGGYIGIKDLSECVGTHVPEGVTCSPFEGMKAASGLEAVFHHFELKHGELSLKRKVAIKAKDKDSDKAILHCPWLGAGVWKLEDGKAVLADPEYFYTAGGRAVDFQDDFLRPFQQIFMEALQKKHPEYIFLSECIPAGITNDFKTAGEFHVYDGNICTYEKIKTEWLEDITGRIIDGVEAFQQEGVPAILGEYGIPAGMKHGDVVLTAYQETVEKMLVSTVLSEYSPEASDADESCTASFNIYDAAKESMPYYKGFARPYAAAVAGKLVSMSFGVEELCFELQWDSNLSLVGEEEAGTEIIIPEGCFPNGWKIEVFDGTGTLREEHENGKLTVLTTEVRRCYLKITAE